MTAEQPPQHRQRTRAIRRLTWEVRNIEHIARHQVVPEEVEEVCHISPAFEQGYQGRLRLVGPTATGRMLAIILAPQGRGVYYPVTARPASPAERRRYQQREAGSQ